MKTTTFADFSERLEFVDQLAQADHDAAIRAEVEGQRARDAAQRLRDVVAQRTRLLATIDRSKTAIRAAIAEQQAMVHSLKVELAKPLPQPKPVQKFTPKPGADAARLIGKPLILK